MSPLNLFRSDLAVFVNLTSSAGSLRVVVLALAVAKSAWHLAKPAFQTGGLGCKGPSRNCIHGDHRESAHFVRFPAAVYFSFDDSWGRLGKVTDLVRFCHPVVSRPWRVCLGSEADPY